MLNFDGDTNANVKCEQPFTWFLDFRNMPVKQNSDANIVIKSMFKSISQS